MKNKFNSHFETIVALATPPGTGAIGVIRLSGKEAISIVNGVFKGKNLDEVHSHTIHLGTIRDENAILDEVLVSIFKAPNSYTKEDVIEISCHGSNFIINGILQLLIKRGARLANPGEFTQRAYLNGRFDLAQAEAVADLIASESEAAHRTAMHQMRGGFSQEIQKLRDELIHFASMIELELDFTEEDVEFASRSELKKLVLLILKTIQGLLDSFRLGNVIKNGVPTVIAGKPNAGKSTLLNALLNEEKAIVSEIPGTTRDVIEDEMVIDGVHFRFIDTAGIRETEDLIEKIGVERTHAKMKEASLILYLLDLANEPLSEIYRQINLLENAGTPFLLVGNKIDKAKPEIIEELKTDDRFVMISALSKFNLDDLKTKIVAMMDIKNISKGTTIITNIRHYEGLMLSKNALTEVVNGIDDQITHDFLALDIRNAIQHLGSITGQITNDDLLSSIFSRFCIGK